MAKRSDVRGQRIRQFSLRIFATAWNCRHWTQRAHHGNTFFSFFFFFSPRNRRGGGWDVRIAFNIHRTHHHTSYKKKNPTYHSSIFFCVTPAIMALVVLHMGARGDRVSVCNLNSCINVCMYVQYIHMSFCGECRLSGKQLSSHPPLKEH